MGFLSDLGNAFLDGFNFVSKSIGNWWNDISGQTSAMDKQQTFNATEAEKQRNFEAEQAKINREYQTQMSNTAVQRQVADMEKAGVNPAMAYANGATGASTPAGSAAHGTAANGAIGGSTNNIPALINSAANLANVMNNDKIKSTQMSVGQVMSLINTVAKIH